MPSPFDHKAYFFGQYDGDWFMIPVADRTNWEDQMTDEDRERAYGQYRCGDRISHVEFIVTKKDS